MYYEKSTQKPRISRESDKLTSKPAERVYTDVVGPMKCLSMGKAKYFVTSLDEVGGFSILRSFFRKSEDGEGVRDIILQMKNLFNKAAEKLSCIGRKTVKCTRSDGGREYIWKAFWDWIMKKVIVHEVMTVYSPESNSIAERLNCTLMEIAQTLLIDIKMHQNP